MSLRGEISEYMDEFGLVSPEKNPGPSAIGNSLYTWLYYIQLLNGGVCKLEDFNKFCETADSCKVPGLPGLFRRAPYKLQEQEGPDDYIGLSLCSTLMNAPYHRQIYVQGRIGVLYFWQWIYNNLTPYKWTGSAWFGRMPQVIAHFHYCFNRKPPLFCKIWWDFSVFFSSFANKKDSTQRILTWCLIKANQNASFLSELAISFWHWRLNKNYPNGMKDVLAMHLGASHPISIYWKD